MSDGFSADAAALDAHAVAVDALTGRLHKAAAAAQPLNMDAYGVIGQVFTICTNDAATAASEAVAELARHMGAAGDGVRATRDAYLQVERDTAAGFGGGR